MSYKNRYRYSGPRMIVARFDSVCAETGKQIKKGDEVLYDPRSKKVYCKGSKSAQHFLDDQFDREVLGQNWTPDGW